MPTAPQIDAPMSLGGFFPDSEDDEEELDQCYETQNVVLVGCQLQVRQFAFHSHNANRVWPGTFNLANYLLEKDENGGYKHNWGNVLELGTATGLLAIRLALSSSLHNPSSKEGHYVCDEIVTSDVHDDEVEDCVRHNFELNGFGGGAAATAEKNEGTVEEATKRQRLIPYHVPHTWGTDWKKSAATVGQQDNVFDTIVASDILLYVSAYPALVKTLEELFTLDVSNAHRQTKFVMSWNRRMKESTEFFERMEQAGFYCHHEGKCVYTFTRKAIAASGEENLQENG